MKCVKRMAVRKLFAKLPLSWKESFNLSVVIPHKMRSSGECSK